MSTDSQSWNVLRHGPLESLAENLWRVEGTLKGMDLKRVMTVARMSTGDLVIHSAIAVDDDTIREIEALGTVAFLIVPSAFHRLDAPAYKERYPDIRVLCPAGARVKIEQVVAVDGDYGDFPADPDLSVAHVDGVREREGIVTVHSKDGVTLVFNDLLFNAPHGKGIAGFVFRYLTLSTGGPRVSRLAWWGLVKDGRQFRAHLERLAETAGLKRIIVAHHQTISEDPAGVLRRVAATL